MENLLRVKDVAEQTGMTPVAVLNLINTYHLEPTRDESGVLRYSFTDFSEAASLSLAAQKQQAVDYDIERFKKLVVPDLINAVSGAVDSRLGLAIQLRDNREARIVEWIGSARSVTVELRQVSSMLMRMLAQVNLAALSGLAQTMPTQGVEGETSSLGIDTPVPKTVEEASMDAEHDAMVAASPSTLASSEIHPETEPHATRRPSKETTHHATTATPKVTPKGSPTTPSQTARKDKPQHQPPLKSKSPNAAEAKTKQYSDTYGDASLALWEAMVPKWVHMTADQTAELEKHRRFLTGLLDLDQEALRALSTAEQSIIEEVLKPWSHVLNDAPRFTSFFAAFTTVKDWVGRKKEQAPPLAIFLALNRVASGAVAPQNFLYMLGLG